MENRRVRYVLGWDALVLADQGGGGEDMTFDGFEQGIEGHAFFLQVIDFESVEPEDVVMRLAGGRWTGTKVSVGVHAGCARLERRICRERARIGGNVVDDPVVESSGDGGVDIVQEQGTTLCAFGSIVPL